MPDHFFSRPNAYLTPVPKETFTKSIRLDPGDISIGRSPSSTIHLARGAVSRHHARIVLVDGQYILSDRQSRNGTYVNRKRIKKTILKHGDKITIGDRSFVFSIRGVTLKDDTALSVSNKDSVSFEDGNIQLDDMVARSALAATRKFLKPQVGKKKISTADALLAHRRLSHLYQLSEKLRYASNTREILSEGINLIFAALPSAERGVAMLRLKPEDALEAHIVKYRQKKTEGDVIPVSQTVINRVVGDNMALVSKNALDDARLTRSDSIRVHGIKSIICVPLTAGDRVIGVLHIDTSQILEPFTQNDLEFSAAVANELSITLENLRLQQEAVQNEKMVAIGLTISNMAHNIKNLLTMNKGVEHLMNMRVQEIADKKIQHSWQLVRKCLGQINDLSINMLNFTRIHPLELKRIDINLTLRSYQDYFKENLTRKNIELIMDLAPDLPEWVMDEPGLRWAVLNLVVNANDAIQKNKNGRIIISTRVDDRNHLNISVSDNGGGIEQVQLVNVFQPFFTTKGIKGSGLGLPMVQRFAERLGGTVSIDSRVGEGSTFKLNIPRIEETDGPEGVHAG